MTKEVPNLARFVGMMLISLASIASISCGNRTSYDLSQQAGGNATMLQGQTQCSKSNCPKLELFLDVAVPAPGSYSAVSQSINVPAGSTTQIRFLARMTDKTITRQAALLPKISVPWLTGSSMEAGSFTLQAAPPAGAIGKIEFQVRDMTYCQATSQTPKDCNKTTVTSDSDKTFNFTITTTGMMGQANGAFVLPSVARCAKPPSDMEQTVGTLQQAASIGASLLSGNFLPVITNIAGGLAAGAQADRQGARQGC